MACADLLRAPGDCFTSVVFAVRAKGSNTVSGFTAAAIAEAGVTDPNEIHSGKPETANAKIKRQAAELAIRAFFARFGIADSAERIRDKRSERSRARLIAACAMAKPRCKKPFSASETKHSA